MTLSIQPLQESDRVRAAELYWEAFEGKLGRILCPQHKAILFLSDSLRPVCSLAAYDPQGTLLGLAGYKLGPRGFVEAGFADLGRCYGWSGALWRAPLLDLFERPLHDGALQLDGICVAASRRGQGIGSALLDALADLARTQGLDTIRLDVIGTNERARALYLRHGFTVIDTASTGWVSPLIGFGKYTTMLRKL